MPATVLVVDDERNIQLTLSRALSMEGYAVETASGGREALEKIAALPVDVVVMDVRMPDLDGLAVLQRARETRPELPIVIMSGHGSIDTVRSAFKLGAFDYLEKPITEKEKLLVAVKNALALESLRAENAALRRAAGQGQLEMIGGGPAMQRLFDLVRRTAPSEGRVLITGENGTGKELVARAIHEQSRRRDRPFVKLNCAAVPAELIESELFGHERGAFTGAVAARRGRFEQADGGTLFLDEVGDMPAAMQAKVLRVLQEGELERVGGQQTLRCDVRVVAATNKDLQAEVAAGRFREDLYYRLNVVPIHTPALRDHKEDVPELAARFLAEACERNGRRAMRLGRDAVAALQTHDWPGNVRELRNLVERLAILCDGPEIGAEDVVAMLPGARRPRGDRLRAGAAFHELVEEAEREIVLAALEAHQDNVSDTARALGLERSHLYKKMRALGIKRGAE
ncbi:two component, sigma54 specific, transcriptional regulator, Fis family [Anaeromyxobacter dehalogenans 2CP-1]|uniref:Two component, sigma54 specific, transcriptional regulator, Fis family n=1 Tax=Anaeromyxobacter dehalogenans (strain ATCC BAA-258 / DSM 21875 / 2CP-1) TaxID=455488 RepID=B8J5F1_ANAD2|nr:sigma-54 dependent transcriptional regulator [Anaeromyxobacter dehalogenans]ACL66813.1 two component, sigma54 specific, transcriptional regulator, Fis family [Anaeromyxobacter dehalogenans 2CP-1]